MQTPFLIADEVIARQSNFKLYSSRCSREASWNEYKLSSNLETIQRFKRATRHSMLEPIQIKKDSNIAKIINESIALQEKVQKKKPLRSRKSIAFGSTIKNSPKIPDQIFERHFVGDIKRAVHPKVKNTVEQTINLDRNKWMNFTEHFEREQKSQEKSKSRCRKISEIHERLHNTEIKQRKMYFNRIVKAKYEKLSQQSIFEMNEASFFTQPGSPRGVIHQTETSPRTMITKKRETADLTFLEPLKLITPQRKSKGEEDMEIDTYSKATTKATSCQRHQKF